MALADSYLSSPSILLFADSPAGLSEQTRAIHRLDGRIAAAAPINGAIAKLDDICDIGAVVVDATADAPDLERLLDRLDLAARQHRYRSVVTVTPGLIDLAVARCPHRDVQILCGGGEADRIAALALALAGTSLTLAFAAENDRGRLKQLSEEVGRIAKTLAALSETDAEQVMRPALDPAGTGQLSSSAPIRAHIRARRMREQYFSAELFADPAWDMLLDLMAAKIEGGDVAVSSLCIAAAVPATTGLRWIKTLTDEGLFVRVADPLDGRRVFIELSEAAANAMSAYFRALDRAGLSGA